MIWFKSGKKTPAIQKQPGPAKYHQESDWQRPIVEAIGRVADQIKSETKEEEKEDRARARREVITIGLIFLTFGAAFAGDIIFFVNLQDARRAIKIQHQDTQSTLIESERAWISPELVTYVKSLDTTPNFTINLSYQNVGKEPALDERTFFKVDVFDVSTLESYARDDFSFVTADPKELERICNQGVSAVSSSVVYPDNAVAQNWAASPSEPYNYSDIASGKSLAIMHGCLRYTTFATIHYSVFCRILLQDPNNPPTSWQWHDCASGNYAD